MLNDILLIKKSGKQAEGKSDKADRRRCRLHTCNTSSVEDPLPARRGLQRVKDIAVNRFLSNVFAIPTIVLSRPISEQKYDYRQPHYEQMRYNRARRQIIIC